MTDLRLSIFLGTIDKSSGPMLKVMGAGKRMAQTVQQSQAALKGLNQQQRQLQGFATLKNKTDASRLAMRAAAQNVRTLSAQMAAMESPTKRASAALDKAKRASDKLKSAHQGNLAALRASRQGLNAAGIGAKSPPRPPKSPNSRGGWMPGLPAGNARARSGNAPKNCTKAARA